MSDTKHLPPEALNAWLAALATELGLSTDEVSIPVVLDVARDVAHGVARPAAPLSTFLMGLALGRAQSSAHGSATATAESRTQDLREIAETITQRAKSWTPDNGTIKGE
ncbi:DUF6457 domain-containing protein [Lysinibacter sp. HNR]|uniref:DUF6457 domain-containing protein n=1 Tax=Lysinibacter sp. HNR TaxID=3031408 RepID=UPI00243548B5|nr:DUF6457 domain-containing protein [Lysinibacter sp. HNR]WGD36569.1 DUF6457 domain-containing protein [Lysinibacter sp. HNR]